MRKGSLTREQAIEIVGLSAVKMVEAENNRINDEVEFSSTISFTDMEDNDVKLIAYYYQDQENVDNSENLDELNWEIHGYEVI